MTGAGFRGCAIALVKNDKVNEFKNEVSTNYEKQIKNKPSFYTSGIGNDIKVIK